jgi:putative ABC transport system permease protein
MGLRHVLRRLLHLPMFTSVAVLTLAIGIGANAAIFTVLNGVLLKPLPYEKPEELVSVETLAPGLGLSGPGKAGIAPFLYFTYRDDNRTFQSIGIWTDETVSVTGVAEPEEVRSLRVSDDVLTTLSVRPLLGRSFSRTDDSPGKPETTMLTFGYWRARFGGDPSVIGRRIVLDGKAREIIGILPADFGFLDTKVSLLLPMQLDRSKTFLGNFSFQALGRLKPGVTTAQANADLARLIPLALQHFPPFPGWDVKMFESARLAPDVGPLKAAVVGDVGAVLWVLTGTIAMVLLIACANVASLLLVRAGARQQELAIRAAIGAGSAQIARELLLESVMLAAAGGLIGLGLAYGAARFLIWMAPSNLPRLENIGIDASVLLVTAAVSLVSGLAFGIIPVLRYAGTGLECALRGGGRTVSASKERHHVRNTLVVVQVALALVLLVSAGLMVRTFQALRSVDPGFTRPETIQTLRISIPEAQVADPVAVVRMEQEILNRIQAIPGVSSVGISSYVPMTGAGWQDPIYASDRVYPGNRMPPLRRFKFASPGLFATMGNRLIAGRDFTWTDLYEKRPVALVSENLARELWQRPEAALGKQIRESTKNPWREVVGVVSDQRDDGANQNAPTIAFWPLLMEKFEDGDVFVRRSPAYMIRSSRTGNSRFLDEVARAVWAVNPNLPLANVRTLEDVYKGSMARTSFTLVMLAIAAAMALLLGFAGLYGVISYSVTQRVREIGIRVALGARTGEVLRMFVNQGIRLTGIGIACGLTAAALLGRAMSSLLFGVRAADPQTYAVVALGLLAAASLASFVPALRATSVNPVEALRAE